MTLPSATLDHFTVPCPGATLHRAVHLPAEALAFARDRIRQETTTWRDGIRESSLPLPVAAAAASFFSLIMHMVGDEAH